MRAWISRGFSALIVLVVVWAVQGMTPGAAASDAPGVRLLADAYVPLDHDARGRGHQNGDDDDDDDDGPDGALQRFFRDDPLTDPAAVVAGAALDRLTWNADDDPAFPGDPRGSLSAVYDSSQPAGLFGFALPQAFDQDDAFTAAMLFVIDGDTFAADPNGFFQISWGLWNSATTGLNRTGNLDSFASDSFELIEFSWFPNASDFFGGPFLGPTVLGAASGDTPDAFANGSFVFDLAVNFPTDVPLLAVLEHRPADGALVTTVYEVLERGRARPLNGAIAVNHVDALPLRQYLVDTIGLTLWQDGFGGPIPAVFATLDVHALIASPGVSDRVPF